MEQKAMQRFTQALRQYASEQGVSVHNDELGSIARVVEQCGEATQAHKMALRVGRVLLKTGMQATIVAPCCPDYEHADGKYTFKGVGANVPLLAKLQISFLDNLLAILPNLRIKLVLADIEADDALLCRKVGKTPEEFAWMVGLSVIATRVFVWSRGNSWQVETMSTAIPSIHEVDTIADQLLQRHYPRLLDQAIQRQEMYRLIDPNMKGEDAIARTARTAAQYVILGKWAAAQDALIVNHTTTNLMWYREAGAAVLHNSVQVY